MGVHGRVFAVWLLQGHLCEEMLGLSHVGNHQSQPAPADPPRDTAEPLNQDGGILGNMRVRKGKKLLRRDVRSVRNSPAIIEVRGGIGGGGA